MRRMIAQFIGCTLFYTSCELWNILYLFNMILRFWFGDWFLMIRVFEYKRALFNVYIFVLFHICCVNVRCYKFELISFFFFLNTVYFWNFTRWKSGNFQASRPKLSIPPNPFPTKVFFISKSVPFYIAPSYRSYIIREMANTPMILFNIVPQIVKV